MTSIGVGLSTTVRGWPRLPVTTMSLAGSSIWLAVGAVAVGFLAGMLIPSTRVEDEKLGSMSDEVIERAKETGQEALERGKQVAQDAAETAKESGREHADELKTTAQQHAQATAS